MQAERGAPTLDKRQRRAQNGMLIGAMLIAAVLLVVVMRSLDGTTPAADSSAAAGPAGAPLSAPAPEIS